MPLYQYAPILTIVQNAAVQLNLTKPSGVYDSADETAQLMGAFANLVGTLLSESEDWQQLSVPFSVTGDGTTTEFPLPNDLSRFKADTGWSHAKRRPVIIINAQQWAAINAWLSQSFFVNPACRIFNDNLQFMTAPADTENITFEYLTKNWVIDGLAPTLLKESLTQNSDIPKFDAILFTSGLKLKWLETRGMPTGAVKNEFDQRYLQLTARDNMAQALSLNGGTFTGFRLLDNFYNAPDVGYGS